MHNAPIVLVDASSFLYRAFHALPDLRAPDGQPTGATYGVLNMLRRLLREYKPQQIAAIFDAPGPTFRHERYADYKAQRPPMPAELVSQLALIHEGVCAMGLPILQISGVEADDVIGTLAQRFAGQGEQVLIVTGDKDLAQLVDAHVHLLDTMSERYSDPDQVLARFGVPPKLIGDYLALVGDSVDNVPGVPGVGPKTAVKWLQAYGSLDQLIAKADEIKGKVGESLRASLAQLPLCRELVAIHCSVDLPTDLDLTRQPADQPALRALFQRLGFKSWLQEVAEPVEPLQQAPLPTLSRQHYRAILSDADLTWLLAQLERADWVALDTETTGLNPYAADLVGFCFAWSNDGATPEAVYLPLGHDYIGAPAQLPKAQVLAQLKPWLENPQRLKIGQNLKFDLRILWQQGIQLAGIARDTMLQSYVLNSTAHNHDMDSLAEKILGHKTIKFTDIAGKGKQQITFNQVALEQATEYAAEDADITWRLDAALWPRLQAEANLRAVFEHIEMPLLAVLARIEHAGVKIDAKALAALSGDLAAEMAKTEAAAHQLAGQPFNLNSPKQIQEILFDQLKLPVLKKTPGGQPSTDEAVLSELAEQFDFPRLLIDYRGLAKLKNTYADALPRMIDPATGRVHTSFHQAVAATGRLSSADPNLQNIPVRTAQGRRIRQAFIAEPGYLLVSADYSQIELRIMAHLSGDAGLLKAFQEGRDIHQSTAAEVFDLPLDAVDAEHRRRAKAINFGLIYGMSAFGLAKQLKIERGEAQRYVNLYFERYPGVRRYMDEMRQRARDLGYVETLFGRRLYIPDIRSSNPSRRGYAERTAINAPMQGTAADLIKKAMIAVDAWLQADPKAGRMILQVHDELVLEVPETEVAQSKASLAQHMRAAATLSVPLEVSVAAGDNWDEAH